MEILEQIMDSIVESLRSGLQPKLDELNARVDARYSSGDPRRFHVPEIPDASIYFGGAGEVTPEIAPAVELAIPAGIGSGGTEGGIAVSGPGGHLPLGQVEAELGGDLILRAWNVHPDFERLYRTNMRYLAGLYNVLLTPGAESPEEAASVEVSGFRFAFAVDPETGEREEFFAGVLLALTLATGAVRE